MAVEVRRSQRNPLDWALDRLGMQRKEFEIESGLSKSYLLRVSQGRHSHLSERVLSSLYSLAKDRGTDLDTEIIGEYGPATDLPSAYEHWQIVHRSNQTMPAPVKDAKLNPFMRLVKAAGGVARMSALLAAPDTLVDRYAKGVSYQMPLPVMTALTDMGYEHIEALDRAMRAWEVKHG